MADDHYVSAHLQVEERGGHMASRGPSVDTSLGSNIFFKFAHSERSLLELLQDFPPQFWVLRLPLPGSVPPSSPRLGKGFRISSHQRMVERIVFGEHDRSSVGPMFEELLLVPAQAIQVRQSKRAESAPEGDHMGRRDHVDRVQLNVAQVAYHGKDCSAS